MEENSTPVPSVKKQSGLGMVAIGIVIGAVLIGGGYYVWTLLYPTSTTTTPYTNTYTPPVPAAPSATTTTTTTTTTPTPAPASTTIQYDSSQYGFSLTLPKTWANYKVKTVVPDEAVAYLYFEMPTTDSIPASSSNDTDYYSPFAISVYTPSQWAALQLEAGPTDTLITQDSQYVFTWSHANGMPATDWKLDSDIDGIIASFEIN